MQTILICDDEKDIVSALTIYLQAEGYRTFSAYNGKEALAILEREDTMKLGGIEIDDKKKTVTRDGEPVSLTPREYDILKFLMQHPGEVFSPSELYRRVWNEEPYGAESTVAVHIRHLREKLEITPAQPRWIKAVWGQGYKMEN